jgi:hypothetical protein
MKRILALLAVAGFTASLVYGEVARYTVEVTCHTNAAATVSAQVGSYGTFDRAVFTPSAYMTSVVVAVTDVDGTAIYSGTITGATMATTWTTNVLHGNFYVYTSNALTTSNIATRLLSIVVTENK